MITKLIIILLYELHYKQLSNFTYKLITALTYSNPFKQQNLSCNYKRNFR